MAPLLELVYISKGITVQIWYFGPPCHDQNHKAPDYNNNNNNIALQYNKLDNGIGIQRIEQ